MFNLCLKYLITFIKVRQQSRLGYIVKWKQSLFLLNEYIHEQIYCIYIPLFSSLLCLTGGEEISSSEDLNVLLIPTLMRNKAKMYQFALLLRMWCFEKLLYTEQLKNTSQSICLLSFFKISLKKNYNNNNHTNPSLSISSMPKLNTCTKKEEKKHKKTRMCTSIMTSKWHRCATFYHDIHVVYLHRHPYPFEMNNYPWPLQRCHLNTIWAFNINVQQFSACVLTWPALWRLLKWTSGIKRTGWDSRSDMVLKNVISDFFWGNAAKLPLLPMSEITSYQLEISKYLTHF